MFHISIKFDLNVRKTGWKKIRFQLARLTASSHRPSSTEDSSTAKEQKLTKQCFLPYRFSKQSSTFGVLNWVSTDYTTTDSEHKLHKTGIENWLPIGFNFALITITLCSTTNGKSLKV